MKKIIILLIIVIALGVVGAYRIHKELTAQAAESIDKQQLKTGVPVRIYEVRQQDLQRSVSISGSIEALQTVNVAATITEHIETIHVSTGQQVGQGDLLVTLDDTKSKLRLAQAEASLRQARENLRKLENGARPEELEAARALMEQAQVQHDLQKIELERQRNLYKEQVVTLQVVQNTENLFNTTKAALDAARAQYELLKKGAREEDIELARIQVDLAQVAHDQAQKNLDDHYLHARIDGQVTLRRYEQGDIAEMNKTIFQIVHLDEVYLVLDVSELYLPNLQIGMEVAVTVDPLPGKNFTGRIAEINPVANELDRSYKTKILIDNREDLLKPGMFGRAEMVVARAEKVLAAPGDALRKEGEQTYVLIVDDNLTAQRRDVTVVGVFARLVQLAGGIAEGDKIISFSQDIVQAGTKVKMAEAPSGEK